MWLKVNDDNDNDVNDVEWYNIWWYDAYDEKHIQNKDRDQCWPSTDLKITKIQLYWYWILLIFISRYCTQQYPLSERYYKIITAR